METKNLVLSDKNLTKVYLRPLQVTDAEKSVVWINDSEIRKNLRIVNFFSLDEERNWIKSRTEGKNDVHFAIITKDGEQHIGNIGLKEIDWENFHATSGTVIGDADFRGRMFGREAKFLLLQYAFDTLGLIKVCSTVLATNTASIKYQLATGYQQEACLKKHAFVEGKGVDVLAMAVFRDEYMSSLKKYTNKKS